MTAHVLSVSGGRDSLAMLLGMAERGMPIDHVLYFNGGWDFPSCTEHVRRACAALNVPLTELDCTLGRPKAATYATLTGGFQRYGWPHYRRRWCTREKLNTLSRHTKTLGEHVEYVGYAVGEEKRAAKGAGGQRYPLLEWGWTPDDCLDYCSARGYDWKGLYGPGMFTRLSCYCCPLQGLRDWRLLRTHRPELWERALRMEREWSGERGYPGSVWHEKTLADLAERFAGEDRQPRLFSGDSGGTTEEA